MHAQLRRHFRPSLDLGRGPSFDDLREHNLASEVQQINRESSAQFCFCLVQRDEQLAVTHPVTLKPVVSSPRRPTERCNDSKAGLRALQSKNCMKSCCNQKKKRYQLGNNAAGATHFPPPAKIGGLGECHRQTGKSCSVFRVPCVTCRACEAVGAKSVSGAVSLSVLLRPVAPLVFR